MVTRVNTQAVLGQSALVAATAAAAKRFLPAAARLSNTAVAAFAAAAAVAKTAQLGAENLMLKKGFFCALTGGQEEVKYTEGTAKEANDAAKANYDAAVAAADGTSTVALPVTVKAGDVMAPAVAGEVPAEASDRTLTRTGKVVAFVASAVFTVATLALAAKYVPAMAVATALYGAAGVSLARLAMDYVPQLRGNATPAAIVNSEV